MSIKLLAVSEIVNVSILRLVDEFILVVVAVSIPFTFPTIAFNTSQLLGEFTVQLPEAAMLKVATSPLAIPIKTVSGEPVKNAAKPCCVTSTESLNCPFPASKYIIVDRLFTVGDEEFALTITVVESFPEVIFVLSHEAPLIKVHGKFAFTAILSKLPKVDASVKLEGLIEKFRGKNSCVIKTESTNLPFPASK